MTRELCPRRRHQPRRNSHRRLVGVLLIVFILFGGLVVKLAQLQTVGADRYTNYAKGQRTHTETLPAVRGAIYDRAGRRCSARDRVRRR